MMELAAILRFFSVLFGVIGSMRGWVRELQVTASAVLGMFIIEKIGPWLEVVIQDRATAANVINELGTVSPRIVTLKAALLLIVVFFGYQGPVVIQSLSKGRANTNRLAESRRDNILGFAVGLLNGYLIVGAMWWYLHTGGYPFEWVVDPATFTDSMSLEAVKFLPQSILISPWLEILTAAFFLAVLIVVI